jgi:6-phosphofructokinase 2
MPDVGERTSARIATLTLNPALDLSSVADVVQPVHKIRTVGDHVDAGGGGINVARVVHALGGDTLAVIATGGVTGRYVEGLLDEAGVPRRSVPIAGRTRISLTVQERSTGLEYRFVPQGPVLAPAEWQAILAALEQIECRWLVLSGSLPPGAPQDAYARIARKAAARGQLVALDTSGPALEAALDAGVALVKPSLRELEAVAGRPLPGPAQQEQEAMAIVRSGRATLVALTLGAAGALLASAEGVVRLAAPAEPVHTAVGAGDAFLGALVLALTRGAHGREALAWGIAAGAAAVAQTGTARLDRPAVERRFGQILVQG